MEPQPRGSGNIEPGLVAKPTWSPYINYVQAFRQSYKGPPVSCPQMVRLAADSWKSLSPQQKEPFVTLAKATPRRRRTKRLQRARRSITTSRTTPSRPVVRGVKRARVVSDSGSD